MAELAKARRNLLLALPISTDVKKGSRTQQRTDAGVSDFDPKGTQLSSPLSHNCVKPDKSLRVAFVSSHVEESHI